MPFQVTFLLGVFPIEFQSPFGLFLFKDMLESVLSGKRNGFLAVLYELVAEFTAEMRVRTEIGVVVCPVKAILPDAVVCCQYVKERLVGQTGRDTIPP